MSRSTGHRTSLNEMLCRVGVDIGLQGEMFLLNRLYLFYFVLTALLFGTSGGGLLGSKTVTTTAPTITTSITNKGLGGLDVSLSNRGFSQGSASPAVARENVWPPELLQTVDKFK